MLLEHVKPPFLLRKILERLSCQSSGRHLDWHNQQNPRRNTGFVLRILAGADGVEPRGLTAYAFARIAP
jgi:hypothetical protein